MRLVHTLALIAALLLGTSAATAQTDTSSLADKQRFVATVQKLERTPLDPALQADRSWAIGWLTDAPDITVTVCMEPVGSVSDKGFPHNKEMLVQYMFGMAAFIIQNPGKENDQEAQQLAGVQSALVAYQSLRIDRPEEKSPELEALLAAQGRGDLPAVVRKAWESCQKKR